MQENPILTKSGLADAAIASHRFVKKTTTGDYTIAAATAGTDSIDGVMAANVAATTGQTVPVTVMGTAIVEASGAITRGAYVTATTAGKAIATTTPADTVRGIARTAATNSGDLIEIDLVYFFYHA